jgi:hypothetical protein
MTVKITQVDTVYTLVRIEELPAGSGMTAYALPTGKMADPLTYADAKLGQRGVQLLSIVEVRPANQPKDAPAASDAYEFTGKITPPAAASAPGAASTPEIFPSHLQ